MLSYLDDLKMGKGTPWGFYQGNRSEYLAIPALSKLGFTIPVPRQEDRFGVDFIVHLANLENKTMIPSGKSFGIQIKSNEEPLSFEGKEERECLWHMSIPFFLGVISRENLTLTIYNTLGRLCFFWMKGLERPFQIIPKSTGEGLSDPDYEEGKVWTGKPILEISLGESPDDKERLKNIKNLQSTMKDWITLENEILSLREQKVPLVWLPSTYETNHPIETGLELPWRAYTNPKTLPDICIAADKTLHSLYCYLEDYLTRTPDFFDKEVNLLIKQQFGDVGTIRKRNRELLTKIKSR